MQNPTLASPRHKTGLCALLFAVLTGGALLTSTLSSQAGEGRLTPVPALDEAPKSGTETAIFAGGCFWGVQGVYQHVDGVVSATSGYIGGAGANPDYGAVSRGTTGHAEAVRITYDPAQVSYGELLQIFFSVVADPTTLNYQGPDHGTQYRTAIFPTTTEQARVATAYIAQLEQADVFDAPIVTAIEPASRFYRAEDYHQDYLTLNPTQPYIVRHDLPKIADLKSFFPASYRTRPVLERD